MRLVRAVVLTLLSIWFCNQPASAGKRVALVIGNSVYQNVTRLANPANDSVAMSAMLKSAGFDIVELKRDLKANETRRALRDFSDNVRGADVAIVYFAGHGIEIDGVNYVIPVDAVLERDIDAFDEAIPLDRILTVIDAAKQLRLVILDACRDNPFDRTMKRTAASRSIGRGLARVEPTSPNTLIAFAARAGSIASDGDSRNSPFTAALVKYLPKPGLDLRKAFGFTRDEVLKVTNNKQEPFIYGSLGGDDFTLVPAATASPSATSPVDTGSPARRDYELALQIGTRDVWNSFISTYPTGFYSDLAKARRDKLAQTDNLVAAKDEKAAVYKRQRLDDGVKASEHTEAAMQAKGTEATRVVTDKDLGQEEVKAAEAERTKAAAQTEQAGMGSGNAKSSGGSDDQEKAIGQIATLAPPEQHGDMAKSLQPTAVDIPRLLQTELHRVGCNTGAIDGNWNVAAQGSLRRFNNYAQTRLNVRVASLEALDTVRSKAARVCPVVCDHGYKTDGDNCNKIVCRAGFEVGDDNACHKTRKEAPAAKREHGPTGGTGASGSPASTSIEKCRADARAQLKGPDCRMSNIPDQAHRCGVQFTNPQQTSYFNDLVVKCVARGGRP